jgi:hypothetical protein
VEVQWTVGIFFRERGGPKGEDGRLGKLVQSEVISNSFCDLGLMPRRYGVVLVRGETLILSKTAPFW